MMSKQNQKKNLRLKPEGNRRTVIPQFRLHKIVVTVIATYLISKLFYVTIYVLIYLDR